MPVTIIGSFVSPYVRKVLAALLLKDIAFVVDPITPFFGNDEFERLSPLRRIPVFIDGDTVVTDSSIICEYLDETNGGHALYPRDPADRARARWIEEYADSRLGELIIWNLFYQRFVRVMVWKEEPDEERIRDTLEVGLPTALDYLETQCPTDSWLFDSIGAADIAVATFFRNAAYVGFTIDADRWPRTAAFVGRVLAHPVMETIYGWERIQLAVDIKGRRQALLDAGAPLSEHSWGLREPRRGLVRL
jgi:glutathione S-transferase